MIDAYSEGLIDKTEFDPRVNRSKERLEKLKDEFKEKVDAAQEKKELSVLMTRFEDFSSKVQSELENSDPEIRREIVRAIVKRVEVNKKRVRIVYRVDPMPPPSPNPTDSSQHCPKSAPASLRQSELPKEAREDTPFSCK